MPGRVAVGGHGYAEKEQHELRIMVDAGNPNDRDGGWVRMGPRMPSVDSIGAFPRSRRFASTCDFRNFL